MWIFSGITHLESNAFPDLGSVSRIRKKVKKRSPKNEEGTGTRRPGTPASLPWSLETTSCGYKINMAAKEVGIDVVLVFSIKKCC